MSLVVFVISQEGNTPVTSPSQRIAPKTGFIALMSYGARIGEAFQVADDLKDVTSSEKNVGKPTGQDAKNSRPSAVNEFGVDGAINRLQDILSGAIASIPACPGEARLCDIVRKQAKQLMPSFAADRVL